MLCALDCSKTYFKIKKSYGRSFEHFQKKPEISNFPRKFVKKSIFFENSKISTVFEILKENPRCPLRGQRGSFFRIEIGAVCF